MKTFEHKQNKCPIRVQTWPRHHNVHIPQFQALLDYLNLCVTPFNNLMEVFQWPYIIRSLKLNVGRAPEGPKGFNSSCSQDVLVIQCSNCGPNERPDPEDPLRKQKQGNQNIYMSMNILVKDVKLTRRNVKGHIHGHPMPCLCCISQQLQSS
jgi:hypothetical protein